VVCWGGLVGGFRSGYFVRSGRGSDIGARGIVSEVPGRVVDSGGTISPPGGNNGRNGNGRGRRGSKNEYSVSVRLLRVPVGNDGRGKTIQKPKFGAGDNMIIKTCVKRIFLDGIGFSVKADRPFQGCTFPDHISLRRDGSVAITASAIQEGAAVEFLCEARYVEIASGVVDRVEEFLCCRGCARRFMEG
jgi:hypothetical protein